MSSVDGLRERLATRLICRGAKLAPKHKITARAFLSAATLCAPIKGPTVARTCVALNEPRLSAHFLERSLKSARYPMPEKDMAYAELGQAYLQLERDGHQPQRNARRAADAFGRAEQLDTTVVATHVARCEALLDELGYSLFKRPWKSLGEYALKSCDNARTKGNEAANDWMLSEALRECVAEITLNPISPSLLETLTKLLLLRGDTLASEARLTCVMPCLTELLNGHQREDAFAALRNAAAHETCAPAVFSSLRASVMTHGIAEETLPDVLKVCDILLSHEGMDSSIEPFFEWMLENCDDDVLATQIRKVLESGEQP